jgi:hypothetical protein
LVFADKHDAGGRIAVGEHQPGGGRFERAAVEMLKKAPQHLERRRGSRCLPRRCDGRIRRQSGVCDNRRCRFGRPGLALLQTSGMCACRPFRLGQPIDRLLGKRAIDPGLQIKGQ